MAVWLPAIKTILPYLTQIITAAVPVFTNRADRAGTEDLTRHQISELQTAAIRNSESLKTLATQLQQAISDIDSASAKIEREIKATRRLALLAIGLSIAAIVLWLFSWMH
jgi:hypothetical protein